MEKKYCAFLRGINVNGINIRMEALKEAFTGLGFSGVKTVLATGNVIFTSAEGVHNEQGPGPYLEKGLRDYFHYDAYVVIRSGQQIQDILFAGQAMDVPEQCHHYHLLCDDRGTLLELKQLFDSMAHAPQEQFALLECGAFWIVPKGSTLTSEFGSKILGNKKYKSRLTSRNMNTIQKIHSVMADRRVTG